MASQEMILNNRYKLLAQQASGGMAVVYKAQDMMLRRTVAVKVLRPSLTGEPGFLERFRQEAQNVANLSHPNIVTVHDFQQDGSTYYIVMEWIEGQDLKKIIRNSAPLSVERALNIAIQICAGVGYAHRAGLVHADVKPQNILVADSDLVKVTDFGIAQALAHTQPQQKQAVVWGSPHYFAPEQAQGDLPTPASDVYSIGIVLFEMLTGKLPFSGTDQQALAIAHIRDAVPHAMDFNPRVPVHLDRIIYKVMSKNPNERYANADALGRILQGYRQQGTENTIDQPVLKEPPPPTNARPVSSGFAPSSQAFNVQKTPTTGSQPAQTGGTPVPPPAPTPPTTFQQPVQAPNPTRTATPVPQPVQQPTPVQPPPQVPQQPGQYTTGQQYSSLYSVSNPNNPSLNPQAYPSQSGQPIYSGQNYGGVNPSGSPVQGQVRTPYATAPDANKQRGAPDYSLSTPPNALNTVTIVLIVIAGLLILGLVPLWLAVLATLGSR